MRSFHLAALLVWTACAPTPPPAVPHEHTHDQSPIADPVRLPEWPLTDYPVELHAQGHELPIIVAEADRQIGIGMEQARRRQDVIWLNCLYEKQREVRTVQTLLQEHESTLEATPAQELVPLLTVMRELCARALALQLEAVQCIANHDFASAN